MVPRSLVDTSARVAHFRRDPTVSSVGLRIPHGPVPSRKVIHTVDSRKATPTAVNRPVVLGVDNPTPTDNNPDTANSPTRTADSHRVTPTAGRVWDRTRTASSLPWAIPTVRHRSPANPKATPTAVNPKATRTAVNRPVVLGVDNPTPTDNNPDTANSPTRTADSHRVTPTAGRVWDRTRTASSLPWAIPTVRHRSPANPKATPTAVNPKAIHTAEHRKAASARLRPRSIRANRRPTRTADSHRKPDSVHLPPPLPPWAEPKAASPCRTSNRTTWPPPMPHLRVIPVVDNRLPRDGR